VAIPKKDFDKAEFKPVLNNAESSEKNAESAENTGLKTGLKIEELDSLILGLMEENNEISIPNIAQKIAKGLTATKDRISKLKSKGLIERVGPDKGGYWRVIR